MTDATLGALVTVALALIGSGGLVAVGRLVWDIRTGRAADERRRNRDARREADLERELRIAFQRRSASLELLALAAGVPEGDLPPPINLSQLYKSD